MVNSRKSSILGCSNASPFGLEHNPKGFAFESRLGIYCRSRLSENSFSELRTNYWALSEHRSYNHSRLASHISRLTTHNSLLSALYKILQFQEILCARCLKSRRSAKIRIIARRAGVKHRERVQAIAEEWINVQRLVERIILGNQPKEGLRAELTDACCAKYVTVKVQSSSRVAGQS